MFYDLFIDLITLFGSIFAGTLVVLAIFVLTLITIASVKVIAVSLKTSKKEARKEMKDNERE